MTGIESSPISSTSGRKPERELSEWIRPRLHTCKRNLEWFTIALPCKLVDQPLVFSLAAIRHKQQGPSCPQQSIGVFLATGADQSFRLVDAHDKLSFIGHGQEDRFGGFCVGFFS